MNWPRFRVDQGIGKAAKVTNRVRLYLDYVLDAGFHGSITRQMHVRSRLTLGYNGTRR
jgi:hypothetical protein